MQRIALGLVSALLLGVVSHIAYAASHKSPGDLIAQLPVGPDGGSSNFGANGKITVPKGAVDKPQTINVYSRRLPQRVTFTNANGTPFIYPPGTLVVYAFGPANLAFLVPVVIVLPIPPGQRGVVFVLANGQIQFLPGVANGTTVRIVVTQLNPNVPGAITVAA